MEKKWIQREAVRPLYPEGARSGVDFKRLEMIARIVLVTSPIWIAAGIGVGAAVAGIFAAISPIALPVWLYQNRDSKKRGLIDKYYNQYQISIEKLVSSELMSNMLVKKKITKITEDWLPKRIQFLEKMITQLSNSRFEIISNRKQITNLYVKLEVIKKSAESLQINR